MDQIEELRNSITSDVDRQVTPLIDILRAQIQSLRDDLQRVQTTKPSLPDPEKFTGSIVKYDTWDAAIRAKLAIDGPAIGDSTAQFHYVYMNLSSQVQAMVLPQLATARDNDSHDYQTILDQLRRVYDNPNKVQEAEDRLLSVRQGADESLAAYIAKFERLLYEARGQHWPDVTKISAFRKGLQATMRNRLTQQLNLPRTYPEFLKIVQQLTGYSFTNHSSAPTPSNGHNSDRMEIGAIQAMLTAAEASDSESDLDATI
ncbi:uncharacterized protein N7515_004760 [Penicillium bovifimosum]|uniref:Retrotransposon gag domain-containing protein n=1 Tax=Penicillium bovifimosum TaxID=126998 RepID=A0A9W9L473_9EURO|nr:uncharacterized protein N7515_004760 [Penicillium bovifimosum]KAJ5135482.1 hypothetical protein N7515_004760 [Penicillium bovifimosum]